MEICNTCNNPVKIRAQFHTINGKKYGPYKKKYCSACNTKSHFQWRNKNLLKMKIWSRKLREKTINIYGGKCACCGENKYEFMAIDHINGGGNKHRKKIGISNIYTWLKKNSYPNGFQVLCHNCNMSKGFYGYCPHNNTGAIGESH